MVSSKILLVAAIASLAQIGVAEKPWKDYTNDQYIAMGCKFGVEGTATWCANAGKKYKCACKNVAELGSWITCAYSETSVNNTAVEEAIIGLCTSSNVTLTSAKLRNSYQNASNYIVDVSKDDSFNKTTIINYPVTSKKLHKTYLGYYYGYKHRYDNVSASHDLGIASLAMWAGLLVIASIVHWFGKLFPSTKKTLTGPFFNFYRKNLSLAPTFKKKHLEKNENLIAPGSIPTRFETLIITIHILYSLLACFVIGIYYYDGDKVFKTYKAGTSRYYGDRAGIICCYQVGLLFLFAGRNNFLQWMTGWDYSRFVTFHKWLARVIIIEVIIHTFAFVAQSAALGSTTSRLAADYYRYGIAASTCCILLGTLASYVIRKHAYEAFLLTHFILAVMFLWTAWKHTEDQGYQDYLWACCGVWIFERFIRVVRIMLFGVRTAKCTFLAEEGTIKLTLSYPSSYWKAFPGSHGFVTFLLPTTFLQSHPFTVVQSVADKNHIHFYCKIKGGVTKVLMKKFAKSEGATVNIKVLVEGPYGHQNPYHHYDKAVLIAGGNGISGPFAHALKLATTDVKTETKLYWQVREYNVLNWFGEELLQLKNSKVHPIIYVSNPNSNINSVFQNFSSSTEQSDSASSDRKEDQQEVTEKTGEKLLQKFDFVDFRQGRLNPEEIVAHEIQEANGSVAFGACAHPSMVDDIRIAVKNQLSSSNKRIEYFEEMQNW